MRLDMIDDEERLLFCRFLTFQDGEMNLNGFCLLRDVASLTECMEAGAKMVLCCV